MKFKLMAIDTYEFGSESFLVGEYYTKEEAFKSKELREKRKSGKNGNTFYRYFVEDEGGNRVYN